MSDKKKTVEVNGEFLLNRVEAIERCCADLRKAVAQGIFQPASPAGINIHALEWMNKDRSLASESASWAWAFAYEPDGTLLDAAHQLVEEIERYEKVEVSG